MAMIDGRKAQREALSEHLEDLRQEIEGLPLDMQGHFVVEALRGVELVRRMIENAWNHWELNR